MLKRYISYQHSNVLFKLDGPFLYGVIFFIEIKEINIFSRKKETRNCGFIYSFKNYLGKGVKSIPVRKRYFLPNEYIKYTSTCHF